MIVYFAYGSNMSTARLARRLGEVEVLGRARLHGYVHRFSKLGRDGTAKGNIEVVSGGLVHGVTYRINRGQFERLVEFEGGYRELELEIEPQQGRSVVVAQSFCALRAVEGLTPSREYVDHYRVGAREHGLPDSYIQTILGGLIAD